MPSRWPIIPCLVQPSSTTGETTKCHSTTRSGWEFNEGGFDGPRIIRPLHRYALKRLVIRRFSSICSPSRQDHVLRRTRRSPVTGGPVGCARSKLWMYKEEPVSYKAAVKHKGHCSLKKKVKAIAGP